MTIRTEQTLRRMWEESGKLQADSDRLGEEYATNMTAADEHDQAAAAEVTAAKACRTAATSARDVALRIGAEAADLADLVNRERQEAGLSPLKPGEPYPAEQQQEQQPTAGQPVQGLQGLQPLGPPATRTDGEVAQP